MQGNPTFQQTCRIVGTVYVDAFLRIEALEEENRNLKSRLELLRKENETLKENMRDNHSWKRGKGNSILPESFLGEQESPLMDGNTLLEPPAASLDSSPPKFIEKPGGKLD